MTYGVRLQLKIRVQQTRAWLFQVDGYSECMAIPWGPTSIQNWNPTNKDALSGSVNAESIYCFGGSLYLLSSHNAAPLVRITRSTQEHPRSTRSTRSTREHPGAPHEHPGAPQEHQGAPRITQKHPGAPRHTRGSQEAGDAHRGIQEAPGGQRRLGDKHVPKRVCFPLKVARATITRRREWPDPHQVPRLPPKVAHRRWPDRLSEEDPIPKTTHQNPHSRR